MPSNNIKGLQTMPVGQEVKEIEQFDWRRARVHILRLHTSDQIPQLKGLQNTYMVAFFGTFGAKSSASW